MIELENKLRVASVRVGGLGERGEDDYKVVAQGGCLW